MVPPVTGSLLCAVESELPVDEQPAKRAPISGRAKAPARRREERELRCMGSNLPRRASGMTTPTLAMYGAFVRSAPRSAELTNAPYRCRRLVLLFAGYGQATVFVCWGFDFVQDGHGEVLAGNEVASWRIGALGVAAGAAARRDYRCWCDNGPGDA